MAFGFLQLATSFQFTPKPQLGLRISQSRSSYSRVSAAAASNDGLLFSRYGLSSRGLRCSATAGNSAVSASSSAAEIRDGFFQVDEFRAHYTVASPPAALANASVPPLIMVHGFGAQSKHFSKNLGAIAAATGADVYALDLLGFGRSEKPRILYGESLWTWEVVELIEQVVKRDKVFLAGNSVGGYICMAAAAQLQERVAGLCLINAAGRFGALNPLGFDLFFLQWPPLANALGKFLFDRAREPAQLRQTLEQVYADKSKVDDELISWILEPAQTPEALFAGPRLFASLFLSQGGRTWEELLTDEGKGYKGPLLAVWGDKDPWIVPFYVDMLLKMRPDLSLHWVDAGHCPHHERPEDVNRHISEWMSGLAAHPVDFPAYKQDRYRQLAITLSNVW